MEFKRIIEKIQNTTPNKDLYSTYGNSADTGYAEYLNPPEAVDPRTSMIHELHAEAVRINLTVEAGTEFKAPLPDGLEANATEIRTEFAMIHDANRPVTMEVYDKTAIFLATATATSALTKYIENRVAAD